MKSDLDTPFSDFQFGSISLFNLLYKVEDGANHQGNLPKNAEKHWTSRSVECALPVQRKWLSVDQGVGLMG